MEDGGVLTDDQAELARMGYKQELKYVQANSYIQVSRIHEEPRTPPDVI